MSAFSFPCQQAIYSALASLAGGRVFDQPPADVGFPYIEIGESQSIPDDTSAASGDDDGAGETFTLHVWDRPNAVDGHRGAKRVRELVAQVNTALHGVSLSVAGRSSALAWIRTVRVMRDPDGVTVHGVVDVEVIHRS